MMFSKFYLAADFFFEIELLLGELVFQCEIS